MGGKGNPIDMRYFTGEVPMSFEEAVKKIVSELDLWIQYHTAMAKLQKAKYDALVQEGFTTDQALILCQKVFG
jgi:hypothetical protein